MKPQKLWIALLLLIGVAGCHWGWINKTNGQFKQQPSYVSVYYLSKYHVLTYQVVSPDLYALLTYHATADDEHPVPYMAGIQIQELLSGKERHRFIGLNGTRFAVKQLEPQAASRIRECFAGSTDGQTHLDGRAIALPPQKLKVKKTEQGQQLTLVGEIRDLVKDKCFSSLLNGERPCFKIVMDAKTRLPVNEYYWAAGVSVVRYVYFPKDIRTEVARMEQLDSLVAVQGFLAERRIFEHLQFDLANL